MSYTLGNITLPTPKGMQREFIEISMSNTTITGKTSKKLVRRKERFILNFINLPVATVNSILSEYNLNQVRSFAIDEVQLVIAPTDVLIDIGSREYPPSGRLYYETFSIILTEVF